MNLRVFPIALARLTAIGFALMAPPRCRCCGEALLAHGNPYLCRECAGKITWIGDTACPYCGYPAGPGASLEHGCDRCRGRQLNVTRAAAVARYRDGVKAMILAFKFAGETELARPLGEMMAARLLEVDFRDRPEAIVPVALHPARRRRRGYDQARLLASVVSKRSGIPLDHRALVRNVHTVPQATLSRRDRLENVVGAFSADAKRLKGRRVLLVDDVMTTGATMAACSRACREAGATRVYALAFAR